MRKARFALIAVIATLVPAGISLATSSFKQTAAVAVTGHHGGAARPGGSVGLGVQLIATDAAAPGAKPKAAQRVVMRFPAGTRFNLGNSVSRVCRLSDAQIKQPFGPMCPAASEVGGGTALINTNPMGVALTQVKAPLVATVRARAHVYVHAGRQLIVVLYLNTYDLPGAPPIILHARGSSSNLTIELPRLIYGKSKKPKFGGVSASIVSLKLTIAPTRSAAHPLIRAGRCENGRFRVTTRFTYFDHSRLAVHNASRCAH
jgi:hypothetical protein